MTFVMRVRSFETLQGISCDTTIVQDPNYIHPSFVTKDKFKVYDLILAFTTDLEGHNISLIAKDVNRSVHKETKALVQRFHKPFSWAEVRTSEGGVLCVLTEDSVSVENENLGTTYCVHFDKNNNLDFNGTSVNHKRYQYFWSTFIIERESCKLYRAYYGQTIYIFTRNRIDLYHAYKMEKENRNVQWEEVGWRGTMIDDGSFNKVFPLFIVVDDIKNMADEGSLIYYRDGRMALGRADMALKLDSVVYKTRAPFIARSY